MAGAKMDGLMHPPPPVRAEIAQLIERLRQDYEERFGRLGGGFNMWWNRTTIGVESLFPGRGHIGPGWDATSTYGRLSWWPFGTWRQVNSIGDAERDLRKQIEDFLAAGKAPRLPGFLATLAGWSFMGLMGSALFALGIAFTNVGLQGWGLLVAASGFALAGAAVLRRALGRWR